MVRSTDYDGTSGNFGCYILLPSDISSTGFDQQLRAYSASVKTAGNKDLQTIESLDDVHYMIRRLDITPIEQ